MKKIILATLLFISITLSCITINASAASYEEYMTSTEGVEISYNGYKNC